ncbi:hypothetical protein ABZ738_00630 [Micromonospora sp. NPDC047793]|uniref:hypothetical protein n=1 Tax=Micromonospora sp. NPDC047793 TaxID=3154342 RepID=UPI0010335B8C|nr:hypothetical protein [Verrucosispora sp. SN26_14.1]TBL36542.1 hypothetical protein EYA84_12065 [Verrucosispora sp. SN26_14.1]
MPPPAGSQVSRVPAQRTPPQEDLAPPSTAPAPPQPRRRLRKVLMVITGAVAALCLAGGITGFVLYDRATAPDRGTPTVVVDSYLRAFLIDENEVRADLLTCERNADLEQLRQLRSDLEAREERFGVSIMVSWGNPQAQQGSDTAQVRVDLLFSARVDGVRQNDRQTWVFTTRLGNDWRVCSATMEG